MLLTLYLVRAIVTVCIMAFVGLAFLPHSLASRLTGLQKFLSERIEERERGRA